MATPPSFTAGQVLTAAQMNKIGMWYIKEATLTGTTVNITSCFSSDFDAYVLVLSNAKTAAAVVTSFQLLSGSTPASGANYNNQRLSVVSTTITGTQALSQTSGYLGTFGNDVESGYTINIYNPYLAKKTATYSSGLYSGNVGYAYLETLGTFHGLSTSYDGISVIATGSSWSSGKAIVYGLRQA